MATLELSGLRIRGLTRDEIQMAGVRSRAGISVRLLRVHLRASVVSMNWSCPFPLVAVAGGLKSRSLSRSGSEPKHQVGRRAIQAVRWGTAESRWAGAKRLRHVNAGCLRPGKKTCRFGCSQIGLRQEITRRGVE